MCSAMQLYIAAITNLYKAYNDSSLVGFSYIRSYVQDRRETKY